MIEYANYSFLALWHFVKKIIFYNYTAQLKAQNKPSETLYLQQPLMELSSLFQSQAYCLSLYCRQWELYSGKGKRKKVITTEFRVTAFKICWSSVMDIWFVTSDCLNILVQAEFNSPRVQGLKNLFTLIFQFSGLHVSRVYREFPKRSDAADFMDNESYMYIVKM